tara:strand:- start:1505 stop:1789 length:285 start_codon:yes stop_codon:yes gene_type:complete
MSTTTFSGPVVSIEGFSSPGNLTADSTTAPVAGGVQSIQMGSTTGFGIYFGSGAPTITAAQGSLYLRTDGSSVSTRAYINTTGSTTWTAITTVA